MQSTITFLVFSALLFGSTGCQSKNSTNTETGSTTPSTQTQTAPMTTETPAYSGTELDQLTSQPNRLVVLETKQGTIKLQLFDKIAPKHVENMLQLVKDSFYNGVTFHRIIAGFMIQGGDPNSKNDDLGDDGFGSGPRRIPAEFSKWSHKRGVLSAARSQDPNSASSQFFICNANAGEHLDGKYSVYGQVVEGMAVVDKITSLPKIQGDNPGKAAEIIKAYVVGETN